MENSIEVLQNLYIRTTIWSSIFAAEDIPQGIQTRSRNFCTSIFVAALFMVVKIWKEPKNVLIEELIKNM
jgi:hypothetical protein